MPQGQGNLPDIGLVLQYFKVSNVTRADKGSSFTLQMVLEQSPQQNIFLGKTEEQRELVRKWIEYIDNNNAFLSSPKVLSELNSALVQYTFFAGHSLTVCDILLYYSLYPTFEKLNFEEKERYWNLSRWFSLVQEDSELRMENKKIPFHRTPLYFL